MFGFLKNRARSSASNKISKEITENIGKIATQLAKGKRNEEETRRWCVDMLRSAFGYKDHELETELSVLGKRADIALLDGEKVIAVIECKAATVELTHSAINQVANYAAALGTEWAIVTNGRQWMMFRVTPKRGSAPDVWLLFSVDILDDDGLSKEDVGFLYLLTKKSILSGETLQAHHQRQLTSFENLRDALNTPEVISMITTRLVSNYKAKHGISLNPDQESVKELFLDIIDIIEES